MVCWSAPLFAAPDASGAADSSASATQTIKIDRVSARIEFRDTDFVGGTAPIITWIERSIRIVSDYYGRFPVADLRIRVIPVDGRGVRGGTTWGSPEALIRMQVGREVTEAQMLNDWILVHEMVHLALPELERTHAWLFEGLATYVEGIARAQAGNRAPADVWGELMRGMPQGLPQSGDQGLDRTHTWGRTYWGGAIFCLLADVEIRTRTNNKFGLKDALRAIAEKSGGLGTEWPITRVIETGDAAVGVTVLKDLYEQMKETAVTPDLPGLWQRLGVERNGGKITLSDDAPLSAVRKGIMQPGH